MALNSAHIARDSAPASPAATTVTNSIHDRTDSPCRMDFASGARTGPAAKAPVRETATLSSSSAGRRKNECPGAHPLRRAPAPRAATWPSAGEPTGGWGAGARRGIIPLFPPKPSRCPSAAASSSPSSPRRCCSSAARSRPSTTSRTRPRKFASRTSSSALPTSPASSTAPSSGPRSPSRASPRTRRSSRSSTASRCWSPATRRYPTAPTTRSTARRTTRCSPTGRPVCRRRRYFSSPRTARAPTRSRRGC